MYISLCIVHMIHTMHCHFFILVMDNIPYGDLPPVSVAPVMDNIKPGEPVTGNVHTMPGNIYETPATSAWSSVPSVSTYHRPNNPSGPQWTGEPVVSPTVPHRSPDRPDSPARGFQFSPAGQSE